MRKTRLQCTCHLLSISQLLAVLYLLPHVCLFNGGCNSWLQSPVTHLLQHGGGMLINQTHQPKLIRDFRKDSKGENSEHSTCKAAAIPQLQTDD